MRHYTITQALAQARLADRHRQAQRVTLARAARQARRARQAAVGAARARGPGRNDCLGWPAKANTGEFVMAPGGHPDPGRSRDGRPVSTSWRRQAKQATHSVISWKLSNHFGTAADIAAGGTT
jgi:hypothetical protein